MRLQLFMITMVMVYCALDNMDCEEMWLIVGRWQIRRKIFMEIRDYIAKHNHLLKPPHMDYHSYFQKMHNFGDLLHSQFAAAMSNEEDLLHSEFEDEE